MTLNEETKSNFLKFIYKEHFNKFLLTISFKKEKKIYRTFFFLLE